MIKPGRNNINFDFFNQKILFLENQFYDAEDKPITDSIQNVFLEYLSKDPDEKTYDSNRLVTLREFPDSGPLFSRFTANTSKIIETTFSGKLESLKIQCAALGGIVMENHSYDLCIRFKALNKIPIILNFNDQDDVLPANALFLFYDNAISFLDLKSLGTLITYLTGRLIQPA